MAAVFYSYNVSLIHATLLLMLTVFVKWPDIEKARELDKAFDSFNQTYLESQPLNVLIGYEMNYIDQHMSELHYTYDMKSLFPQNKIRLNCENMALFMRSVNIALAICHGFSMVVLLFREVRETTLGALGQTMKALEVVGIGFFIMNIVKCCQVMSIFQYYEYMYFKFPDHQDCIRPGLVKRDLITDWNGNTVSFLYIELLLYFAFSLTFLILLVRSRYQPVGTDNSQ